MHFVLNFAFLRINFRTKSALYKNCLSRWLASERVKLIYSMCLCGLEHVDKVTHLINSLPLLFFLCKLDHILSLV